MLQNTYFLAIILYLILILVLGLYFSRGVKTVKSFAIADKKFSTFALLMTFIATSIGAGSTIGDTAKIIRDGIVFPLSMSGFFVFCYYMWRHVSYKFDKRFDGMISAGDIVEHFYGTTPSKIASLVGFVAGSLTVGAQITGLGYLLEIIAGTPYQKTVLAIGTVITIYSALGGIKSVTTTDISQAAIIFIVIPAFGFSIINKAGGVASVISSSDGIITDLWTIENFKKYFAYFVVSFMPFLWLYPPVIQRFLMAQRSDQISKMYKLEFYVRIFLFLMLTLIAAASLKLIPATTSPNHAVSVLIKQFVPTYIGIFLALAIISASMSTADSHLHSSAVLFSHNLCASSLKNTKTTLARIGELKLLQISTLVLGLFAALIAFQKIEIVSLVILSFSLSGAVMGIPLFFGIMEFKVSSTNFYSCLIFSIFALVVFSLKPNLGLINLSSIIIIFGLLGFFVPNVKSKFC